MQSAIEYHGSVSDHIQQFMVGRGPVPIPSLMLSTLSNQPNHLPSQTKQLMQQQGFDLGDSPENPNSHSSIKQNVQGGQHTFTNEDGNAVEEPVQKFPEANRWPREETLALLRIRAAMDANLKDSCVKGPIWETVSRNLAEVGFYRSAKKCKEKFENVSKYYKRTKEGGMNRQEGKNYRFFSELEALHAGNCGTSSRNLICNKSDPGNGRSVLVDRMNSHEGKTTTQSSSDTGYNGRQNMSTDGTSEEVGEPMFQKQSNKKKRKRKQNMGSIKIFVENMVKQVLEHQESLQKKFLDTMEKREQDRLQKEEEWKRQEMARLKKETELRAQEHALQSSREKAIITFLQKFTGENLTLDPQTMPRLLIQISQEGKSSTTMENADPRCKRWPKTEVYALIQLRSEMEQRFKESGPKVALWEEISSAMACMGFNRSPKRCKEKWENINKYFRKTKDTSKKRPFNTKTCPYFPQLDSLYKKGILPSSGQAKTDKQLENHDSSSGALAIIDKDDQQKSNEGQIDIHDPGLIDVVPSSNQGTLPNYNAERESIEAQERMKWHKNLIHTINDQPLALNSGSADEFYSSSSHKRSKMETMGRQQNQHQIFLNGFDRREEDLADIEGHQQQKLQRNQVFKPTEEQLHSQAKLSQSALMALVHRLSSNYSLSPPPTTE